MSSSTCAHDLGPGITVCLRCRQEQRDAARTRQQQMLGLCGVAAMGLLGIYVMGASAANAWHAAARPDTSHAVARASVVASSVSGGSEVKQQGDAAASTGTSSTSTASTTSETSTPSAPAASAAPATTAAPATQTPVAILVSEGRTDLTESLVAERAGDSLVVDFDTPATRTRRRDKFEAVVRRTLPMIYGAPVDSVLRTIPDGGIVGGADLLDELPRRGVHLPLGDGWRLELWPETRPGQDGPLVVSYWARIGRDGTH
jgi:hypothetical protein